MSDASSSYSSLKSGAPTSAAAQTAIARSSAPSPPFAQWFATTASRAPAASETRRTASTSAGVSVGKELIATTTGTLNRSTFSICLARFAPPAVTASTFSASRAGSSGFPATILPTPPCIFSARIVATTTAASGRRPDARHLMSKNFSAPMSAPNPASVHTMSFVARAMRSASTELLPCAMLAKGPQCTNAGPPSRVWSRFGLIASLSNTAIAPATFRSSAVIAFPSRVVAMTIRPSRARRSVRSEARASTAITSDATVITNSVSRV